MIEQAFCLVGILKARNSLERVSSLLPPDRQETVLRLADEFSNLTSHELRKKLLALRESAVLQSNTRLTAELGTRWQELPPFLQCWLRQAMPLIHGNEDHQE